MGVLYSATNFQGMFNLMNVLPVVGYERSVFYRCVLRPLVSHTQLIHSLWCLQSLPPAPHTLV